MACGNLNLTMLNNLNGPVHLSVWIEPLPGYRGVDQKKMSEKQIVQIIIRLHKCKQVDLHVQQLLKPRQLQPGG